MQYMITFLIALCTAVIPIPANFYNMKIYIGNVNFTWFVGLYSVYRFGWLLMTKR